MKKVNLKIRVKPYKIAKYLRVMFQDSSEDMQNILSPTANKIYNLLRIGDGKHALEDIDKYLEALSSHHEDILHLREVLEEKIVKNLELTDGEAHQFVGVDGRKRYGMKYGEKIVMGKKKDKDSSTTDTEVLKDLSDLEEDSLGVDSRSVEPVAITSDHSEE